MVKGEKLQAQVCLLISTCALWHLCEWTCLYTYTTQYYCVRILDSWQMTSVTCSSVGVHFLSLLPNCRSLYPNLPCLITCLKFFVVYLFWDNVFLDGWEEWPGTCFVFQLYHKSRRRSNLMVSLQPEEPSGTSAPVSQDFDLCLRISGWVNVKQNLSLLSLQTQRDRPESTHKNNTHLKWHIYR